MIQTPHRKFLTHSKQLSPVKEEKKHLKWSKEENKLYARFLENNIDELENGRSRRTKFFFKKMAL